MIPNKLQQARPIQVWIQRLSGAVSPTGATLSTSINSSTTTITLSSTANLPYAGFIRIGSEDIAYGYLDGNTLGNVFRAQNGTTAASHTSGDAVYNPNLPSITVWPTPASKAACGLLKRFSLKRRNRRRQMRRRVRRSLRAPSRRPRRRGPRTMPAPRVSRKFCADESI